MSSDPLPYTQVDRAVKPKVALLAGHLGVTPQHAMGSLIEFWDLCAGDQRELERVVEATPPGEEPVVVLDSDDVALRFKLASGHPIEPIVLARLGLLEPVAQRFRVRGMSRYFEPIITKRERREIAVKAGKASAASRRAAGHAVEPGVEHDVEHDVQRAVEPGVEPKRTKQTADSSQQTEDISKQAAGGPAIVDLTKAAELHQNLEAPTKPPGDWDGSEFWRWFQARRRAAGLAVERWPHPRRISDFWAEALAVTTVEALQEAVYRFGEDPYWQAKTPPLPFSGFASQFTKYLPVGGARAAS